MIHETEVKGSDLEGWWFSCSCQIEGQLYDDREPAEMEASVHEATEAL